MQLSELQYTQHCKQIQYFCFSSWGLWCNQYTNDVISMKLCGLASCPWTPPTSPFILQGFQRQQGQPRNPSLHSSQILVSAFKETNSTKNSNGEGNIIVTRLVKKFHAFMGPENTLPCSQQPTTGPSCESDETSPHSPIIFL
jgi:hypothetical protein